MSTALSLGAINTMANYFTTRFIVVILLWAAIFQPLYVLGQGTNSVKFEKECLAEHNRLRALHGASPLTLSRKLSDYAQEWANNLASKGIFEHRKNGKYGENLYMSYGTRINGASAVRAWYDEIKDYNFGAGDFSMKTGHFTQVVWKGSKQLGCATKTNNKGYSYVVANYDPFGNVMGSFDKNVTPPKK